MVIEMYAVSDLMDFITMTFLLLCLISVQIEDTMTKNHNLCEPIDIVKHILFTSIE